MRKLGCLVVVALLSLSGCGRPNPIIGAWVVKDTAAPFPYHMYVFNADGTMQQANPDAGDIHASDSDGKGVWIADGDRIKGKFVEVTADRTTHQYLARGEISYVFKVDGDTLTGSGTARFYDVNEVVIVGPIETTMTGKRVTLP